MKELYNKIKDIAVKAKDYFTKHKFAIFMVMQLITGGLHVYNIRNKPECTIISVPDANKVVVIDDKDNPTIVYDSEFYDRYESKSN